MKDLLTLQAEYYKGLHVSSIKEAVLNTPNLPLSVIRKEITLAGARAILVIAINELVSFFNVGKTMNDVQVALTADLIIDRFYYLKLEEIKLCFRNAMASGKIYDRLDGNIILGWLNEYDAQRDEIVSSLSINEAHEQNNNSTGMFYGEYIKHLTERSENGDEEAKELLESHQSFIQRMKSNDKEAAFRKKLMKWTKRIVISWFFGAVMRMTVRVAASLMRTRVTLGRTRVRVSALALL